MQLLTRSTTHFVTLLALLVLGVFASGAGAATSQVSVIEDPARIYSSDLAQQTAAMDEVKSLGAGIVRIGIPWRAVAPDSTSTSKPATDLSNPDNYPAGAWAIADNAVRLAQERGLRPWIVITYPAPRWAVKQETTFEGNYKIDATAYGHFAKAVGLRYQSVNMFSIWNEPNLRRYIEPQRTGSKIDSAIQYRKMYLAGYSGLVSAGHSSATILMGELLPRTGTVKSPTAVPPVTFLRAFFCLDSKGKKLTGSAARKQECSNFKTLRGTGMAYHPYVNAAGPLFKEPFAENAPITYLKRIEKILDQAYKAKRIKTKNMKIYNSEFGVQTNPPDSISGVSLSKTPGYLNISEYLNWADKRVATYSQYLLIDDLEIGSFQTGLRFHSGEKKAGVYEAFQTPLVVFKTSSSNKAYVWGALRAKGSGSAVAEIQVKNGDSWSTVTTVSVTNSRGYFSTNVTVPSAKSKTFRISWSGGLSRETKPVTKVSPRS